MANFRGMELVPGALEKLSGGGGGNRREPTPPARNLSASCRGDIPPSPGLPIVHARSGSDTLDPRGVGVRPTGSVIRGGRPLSGGSRSGSRVDVNLSTSPNPNQFQPYQQEVVSQFDGNVNSGTGSGPGSDGDSLIQRCVIIQRGEKGYGLTVSGDNPVFVQDVKPHGAAARAGVQPGDRIMKVNGTLVTSSNHVEVVRMIKSGSLVSLTLLGRPPGSNAGHRIHHIPPQPANDGNSNFAPHAPITDITEPKPSEADHEQAMTKVRNLQRYLDKAIAEREVLSTEYRKHPQDKYYGKILENHRLIESLDSQVKGACRKAGIPLPPGMVPEGSLSPSAINSKFPYPYDGTSGSIAYPNSHAKDGAALVW